MPHQFYIYAYAASDVGRVRTNNEDSLLIANLSEYVRIEKSGELSFPAGAGGGLFAVADGMGGAAAGEMASRIGLRMVYKEIQDNIGDTYPSDNEEMEELFIDAVASANRRIFQLSREYEEYRGMGTTLTAVLALNGRMMIAQIGDSRAYLLRRDGIRQLTRDQSLIAQRVAAGLITEEQARQHPDRNILLQALGVNESVELALQSAPLLPGDVLLLCSDGLHGHMSADEIYETVIHADGVESACSHLIDLANRRGGPDNITAVLVQFRQE